MQRLDCGTAAATENPKVIDVTGMIESLSQQEIVNVREARLGQKNARHGANRQPLGLLGRQSTKECLDVSAPASFDPSDFQSALDPMVVNLIVEIRNVCGQDELHLGFSTARSG